MGPTQSSNQNQPRNITIILPSIGPIKVCHVSRSFVFPCLELHIGSHRDWSLSAFSYKREGPLVLQLPMKLLGTRGPRFGILSPSLSLDLCDYFSCYPVILLDLKEFMVFDLIATRFYEELWVFVDRFGSNLGFFLTFYDRDGRGAIIGFYMMFDRLVGIICVFFLCLLIFFFLKLGLFMCFQIGELFILWEVLKECHLDFWC